MAENNKKPYTQIVVWSKKGGVGKTMLSVELVNSLLRTGIHAAWISTDPQGGSMFAQRPFKPNPEVYVIDCEGKLDPKQDAYIQSADLVVVPTSPRGTFEIEPFQYTLAYLLKRGKKIVIIGNFMKKKSPRSKELIETLEKYKGIPKAYILDRTDIEYSTDARMSYVNFVTSNADANIMINAMNVIREAAGLPKEPKLSMFQKKSEPIEY